METSPVTRPPCTRRCSPRDRGLPRVLPVLLHPAGEIVADALCLLAVALVVTAAVLAQRRHGTPDPGASSWTVRNRRRTGRQLY
ncbi:MULTISPECIES: hypothetical protein [unclassified Streptomyces]|uniref:hypothetical protein n=1 Tax=unclassified Streptomyces TaxID=2593676 RepID=UPI002E2B6AA7|nr:hypothetical protein [Streptomyces sp. NBC_00223]